MSPMFYNGLPDFCGSKRFINGTSWMDFLGKAAYNSGLNEDSVLWAKRADKGSHWRCSWSSAPLKKVLKLVLSILLHVPKHTSMICQPTLLGLGFVFVLEGSTSYIDCHETALTPLLNTLKNRAKIFSWFDLDICKFVIHMKVEAAM